MRIPPPYPVFATVAHSCTIHNAYKTIRLLDGGHPTLGLGDHRRVGFQGGALLLMHTIRSKSLAKPFLQTKGILGPNNNLKKACDMAFTYGPMEYPLERQLFQIAVQKGELFRI